MSMNHTAVGGEVQQSLDRRLDAIDRALLGVLPRQERMELVAQIETKLREFAEANPPLGAEPGKAMPDRSDRFDDAVEAAERRAAIRSGLARRAPSRRGPRSRLAVSSGVSGIVALSLLAALPIVYFVGLMLGDEWLMVSVLGGHVTAVALGGLVAVVLGIVALVVLNRHDGRLIGHGWAITGLCTGPLPMLVGGLVALVAGVELWGMMSPGGVYRVVASPASSQAPPDSQSPGTLTSMVWQPMISYAPAEIPSSPGAPAYGDAAASYAPQPSASPALAGVPANVESASDPLVVTPSPPTSSCPDFDPYVDPPVSAATRSASPPPSAVNGEPQPEAPEHTSGPLGVR